MAIRSLSPVKSLFILTTIFLVVISIFYFIQLQHIYDPNSLIRQSSVEKESLYSLSSTKSYAGSNKPVSLWTGYASFLSGKDKALYGMQAEHQLIPKLLKYNPGQIISLGLLAFTGLSFVSPIHIWILFLSALLFLFFSYFKISSELQATRNLQKALKVNNANQLFMDDELVAANRELAFQNKEKEKRAAELTIANIELAFQNEEKEKRAAELVIANLELGFQNEEKEKRTAELAMANLELGRQNEIKEKLAAELILANRELAFQNEENERRATELFSANKELQLFLNMSSHDLQEPLRKIQMSASRIGDADFNNLTPKGKDHFIKMQEAAKSMQVLIDDLLTYSRTNSEERIFEFMDLSILIKDVLGELKEAIDEKGAIVEITDHCEANIIPFQFRQLIFNMLSNALKFSIPGKPPHILISSCVKKGIDCNFEKLLPDQEYCHITIKDNGIGFEPEYSEKIFDVFQRLNGKEVYKGTGIGLAIVKRIVENHNGIIIATSQLNQGATFDIYIPTNIPSKNG